MKEKRIHEIIKYIYKKGFVKIDELCSKFDISISTLRRDLLLVLKDPFIKKVYGGVALDKIAKQSEIVDIEQPNISTLINYNDRTKIYIKEKSMISELAATLINSEDIIFIDSGTTTKHILKYLNSEKLYKLTVLTNNADIINYIINYIGKIRFNLICIGNMFQSSTRSFFGGEPDALFNKFNINVAFMSSTGISLENGITNSNLEEYSIKKHIIKKAKRKVLMITNNKFDHPGLLTYANLNEITDIITLNNISEKYCKVFQNNNTNIHIVNKL